MYQEISIRTKEDIWCQSCSSRGYFIACGYHRGQVRIFSAKSAKQIRSFQARMGQICIIKYSSDDRLLALVSRDNIKIWNTNSHEQVFEQSKVDIHSISFSPNSLYLAIGGWRNCSLNIWKINDQSIVQSLKANNNNIYGVDYSPNGLLLVSCGIQHIIQLWHTGSWLERQSLKYNAQCVKFSKDSKNILVAEQNSVVILELKTGLQLQCFNGHTKFISTVVYSLDEQFVISTSFDMTIRIWKINTQQHIILNQEKTLEESICVYSDRKLLISNSWTALLKIQRYKWSS